MLFFLIFPETVTAEEEDQVGPQAQEDFHNSSTDSCLTFPYSSNSPRPFPPSPVHSVTDSPKRVSPLPIATSNPVTILLSTVLLTTTFLLLPYPLFLFLYLPKLSLLSFLLPLLILTILLFIPLTLLVLFPRQVL